MSDSNKKRVAFQLRSSYGYSAINNTAGSKKRLLTVIGEKEEKGEKTEQSTTISSQTSSTTSGIQTDNSLFQRKKPIVPLFTSDVPKRPSFIGDAYSEITDAGYYKKSDMIGRNYSMTARGLTLRAVEAVLHKGKRIQEALETGVPAQKEATLIATRNKARPFNLPTPEPLATYESLSMKRSISHKSLLLGNSSSKTLLGTSAAVETTLSGTNSALSPNKVFVERKRVNEAYINSKVLITPAPTPRLYKDDQEVPTTNRWRPQPRYSETNQISALLPTRLPKDKRDAQIRNSTKRYQALVDKRVEHVLKMQTQLQKLADSNLQKQWIDNALMMIPPYINRSGITDMVATLKNDYLVSNARSNVSYDLMDSFVAQQAQVDMTALHPPPEVWHDTTFSRKEWKILRLTNVPNFSVVAAYTFMENESFVASEMMLAAQALWTSLGTKLGFTNNATSLTEVDSYQFRGKLPLSPNNFETQIRHFAVHIREELLSVWLSQCQDILLNAMPPEETESDIASNLRNNNGVERQRNKNGGGRANNNGSNRGNNNDSAVLNGITSLKKRYEALDEPEQPHDSSLGMKTDMDEVEEWLSALPSLDEGVAGKNGRRRVRDTDAVSRALQQADLVMGETNRGVTNTGESWEEIRNRMMMNAFSSLLGMQIRTMGNLSLQQLGDFFFKFDNSTFDAHQKEVVRQTNVLQHQSLKSTAIDEQIISGEGVGAGDGCFDFSPRGDKNAYRRVTQVQLILAALSHCHNNLSNGQFNDALLHYGEKVPESVLMLQVVVKDKVVRLSPTLEKVEKTIVKAIMDVANAATNFPRPDSAAAVAEGQDGKHVAKVSREHRMGQRLAASEFVLLEDEALDKDIEEVIAKVKRVIRGRKGKPLSHVQGLKRFEELFTDKYEKEIDKLINSLVDIHDTASSSIEKASHDVADLSDAYSSMSEKQANALKKVTRLNKKFDMLLRSANASGRDRMHFDFFALDLRPMRVAIYNRVQELKKLMFSKIAVNNFTFMQKLCATYEQIGNRLIKEPADAAELKALIDYAENVVNDLDILSNKINLELVKKISFLVHHDYDHSKDDIALTVVTLGWPVNIMEYRAKSAKLQLAEKQRREEILIARKEYFEHELERIGKDMAKFRTLKDTNAKQVSKYSANLDLLSTSLEEAEEEARVISEEEGLLGIQERSSEIYQTTLGGIGSEKEIYTTLWKTVEEKVGKMKHWKQAPLHTLNAEVIDGDADNYRRAMIKISKIFDRDKIEAPLRVANEVREEMTTFCKEYTPLLELMCTKGLTARHWQTMSEKTGIKMQYNADATLAQCLEYGLHKHIEKIEETCVNASKEYSLEKAFDAMEEEWKDLKFNAKEYKDTGTYILSGVDDIQQVLDDQIVRTQAMRGSRYIGPFQERCGKWEKTLNDLQEIIDSWLTMQGTWLYLEPIFSSDDIKKQMPKEAKRFAQVDKTFRDSMAQCVENPSVIAVATTEGLLDKLLKANELLDIIQKGLTDYLETKRVFFPRFFFLSNDELLEILAETKDPTRVQPHLKKCFEGIAKLEFAKNLDIKAMYSKEKEKLVFPYDEVREKLINPNDAGGQVEIWLDQIEKVMRKTVAYENDRAVADYQKMAVDNPERTKWIVKWPGQVVLSTTAIYWTKDVSAIIEGEGGPGLTKYASQLKQQLEDIVLLVRGKLSKLDRKTISALVVLDKHSLDVTANLGKDGINDITDFNWLKEMRYYWHEGGQSAMTGVPDTIVCKIINAQRKYAYEYLGNSARLVITPLTDRCYRTLMTAIHLDYGGAPAGPAGTGKTETVKDLGKAIAVQTVVYNCSDTLDYLAMGKFFKGLAGTGAWACFDEFNRITLEVLSVVAQQILTIQTAKIALLDRFDFEGQNIALRRTCCVYVTMNPGYAGRQELPDNLKALFRNVAMMVPDYAQIGEIILYSMGYMAGAALARKIVTTYRLSSEQLSKQRHYDYGMRAVIAVLKAAGNLKRKNPEAEELVLGLRAIVDVNLPKFLAPDVPLFFGIVGDLFPGIKLPEVDNSLMEEAMIEECHSLGLQPTKYFLKKVFEIWEMMLIRHGFMIVGLPWGGKTKAYRCLQGALGRLHIKYPDNEKFSNAFTCVLNPKSITMGQLYGQFDAVSHEWSDGIVAINYRRFSAVPSKVGKDEDRKWLIFDGPVDAIWIENMNTVLDDNKKLCLESGEMVPLGETCSVMFEPMDLEVASPATVSRVGVIYMEPFQIGWRPLVISWIQKYCPGFVEKKKSTDIDLEGEDASADEEKKKKEEAEKAAEEKKKKEAETAKGDSDEPEDVRLTQDMADHLLILFDWLADPSLCFIKKMCNSVVDWLEQTVINALLNILYCCLEEFLINADAFDNRTMSKKKQKDEEKAELTKDTLEAMFSFSLVWSIGAITDLEGRVGFNSFFRTFLETEEYLNEVKSVKTALELKKWSKPEFPGKKEWMKMAIPFPRNNSIYDYCYDANEKVWKMWMDTLPKFSLQDDEEFSNILIPNVTTAYLECLLQLLVTHSMPVLVVGPTGTGKSAFINKMLTTGLPQDKWVGIGLAFSAKTSANMTQNIVDGRLDKRRKGVFGPPLNTNAVIFVDDVNMPEVEEYGAQPPIELLRQFLCDSGWYDLGDKTFKKIIDTQLICAMGPPGGGRNKMTPRFMRHFSTLCVTSFNDETLEVIFNSIMNWNCKIAKFDSEISSLSSNIVSATLQTYRNAMRELRPTPMKSHYTFNLRDFSRVIQGVCLCRPYEGFTKDTFIRLWVHESLRVFSDRLIDEADQEWFFKNTNELVSIHFKRKLDELFMPLYKGDQTQATVEVSRNLLFAKFLDPSAAIKLYKEVSDFEGLSSTVDQYLEDYNGESKKPMDLVMFMFAIEHATRIARVLAMPGGNMLLVGIGGSGRQSLTRLAAFMLEYGLKQIELSKNYGKIEWFDDIRALMKAAGTGPNPQVFLFADTQIQLPTFVEDINNLLNTGEVPNLFDVTEKIEVIDAVRVHAKNLPGYKNMNSAQLYSYFISRVRANLHIVLAFSPIGDAFRERLRKFPSLVSCCTIDWFFAWPQDALAAVATKFLANIKVDENIRNSIMKSCPILHESVTKASEQFKKNMNRINYVTPTSYLELIKTFTGQLFNNLEKVGKARMRYVVGLEKLDFAAQSVSVMQEELTALLPTLDQAKKDTDVLMKQIEEKLPGVQAMEESVSKEAATVQIEVDKVQTIKAECEADLAEAIPALNSAIAALNTLKKADIDECKNFKKPPSTVVLVMSGVCDMLEIKPQRVKDPNDDSKKINDYWIPAKKLLGEKDFLQKLMNYDKDNIKPKIIKKIRDKYIPDPAFTPESAKKASTAALGLCKWVIAMECYDRVAKVVAPKKAALKQSEAELKIVLKELDEKKSALKAVQDDLAQLQNNLADAVAKKEKLIKDVDLTEKKLIRAQQLIEGLGGEKQRWTDSSLELGKKLVNVPGDVLLSSGLIAYLGVFTSQFRSKILLKWVKMSKSLQIPCSAKPSLRETLGDEVQIRDWNIQGLPTDEFSCENGIVVFNASRWPLMIDPEGTANKWIRNVEKENNLLVIKLSDSDYMRTVENAVQFGQPVLLENVGEELDPTLEPLLLKQVFKQGGMMVIQLGESAIEYSDEFRFYITTKLPNPHYLPETAVKVSLLNFMITPEGLLDQLLASVVREERPDLADEKERLIIEGAKNARILKECEDKILHILSSSEGNILEDESAIEALKSSKTISDDIKVKAGIAAKTEAEIDAVRLKYVPVADNGQLLYFCITSLAAIEPTYQYALQWYANLFVQGIRSSEKSTDLDQRILNLNNFFTYQLYCNICRSLLEKDKILFSFLLTVKILEGAGKITYEEWYFLLTGGVAGDNPHKNPSGGWLSAKAWGEICRLDGLKAFQGIREVVVKNLDGWRVIYDTNDAHTVPLPDGWQEKLNTFQRMLVLRCIRPDKIALAVGNFITEKMGQKFVTPPTFNLKACYEDSSNTQPLVFVLSAGSDPMLNITKFATVMKKSFESVSLGQGQGPKARAMIEKGTKEGTWVVLQNCHLYTSWMPTLEKLCEETTADKTHSEYRLWCTTYPSPDFPVAILQNAVKMTIEPPKGLKQNILSVYKNDPVSDPEFFNSCSKGRDFRKLLFALCFFHANVQERREYGALGWNNPYEYNDSDLLITMKQVVMFLDLYTDPYKAMNYCTGQCNYGGRVTDDKDRRCLLTILIEYFTPDILEDGFKLTPNGLYKMPDDGTYESYLNFIETLPNNTTPDVFGFHSNATITKDTKETTALFKSILLTQTGSGGGGGADDDDENDDEKEKESAGKTKDEIIIEVANSHLTKIPNKFDMEIAALKYPIKWEESMNTVLVQELARYNTLTGIIATTLKDIQDAVKGIVVLSTELEALGNSLFFGTVPTMWLDQSYPSLKSLAGYMGDFLQRLEFMQDWLDTKPPNVFWMSGLYFPAAFLTGTKQNFARRETVPIDDVAFDFSFMKEDTYNKQPPKGVYTNGLFFDGARWNKEKGLIDDPLPKVLFSPAPIIWMEPKETKDLSEYQHYKCPVYRTSERWGILATTGHSTNFVQYILVPSDRSQSVWIRAGIALLCSLD
jgi:dynein heavy chain